MKFVIVGDKFGMEKKEMKNKIKELGGEVASKVEKDTAAVITTAGLWLPTLWFRI